MKGIIVDLSEHKGRVFAGHFNAIAFATHHKLSSMEGGIIRFPSDTKMITTSFLKGFLEHILIRFKTSEDFYDNFSIAAPQEFVVKISDFIEDYYMES